MNSDTLIKTEEYKGFDIEIHIDECDFNPREDDNLSTMAFFHNNYDLGDKVDFSTDDFNNWQEMREYIEKEIKPLWVSPVYLYDHSGITISMSDFGDRWDSGCIGFIYLTRENIKEMMGYKKVTKKRLAEMIESCKKEFEIYDQYIRGEVYSYYIPELEESCGGWYEEKYILEECQGIIDNHLKNQAKEKANKLKGYIKNNVPLIYRFK